MLYVLCGSSGLGFDGQRFLKAGLTVRDLQGI